MYVLFLLLSSMRFHGSSVFVVKGHFVKEIYTALLIYFLDKYYSLLS